MGYIFDNLGKYVYFWLFFSLKRKKALKHLVFFLDIVPIKVD